MTGTLTIVPSAVTTSTDSTRIDAMPGNAGIAGRR
jgi:hypothetical protein